MNTTPSSNTDTTQQARRTEAARWIPESEWYPRSRVDGTDYDTEYARPLGRFMLLVSYDGAPTAEFRDTREEAEVYATYAGMSHGGDCFAFLDLDTGDWTAVRVTRTFNYDPVTAYDLGLDPDDKEVDA